MNLLQRLLSKFRPSPPTSKYSNLGAEQLVSSLEPLIRKAVKSYTPPCSTPPNYAHAEFAAFIYFWLRSWHEVQPDAIRDYDNFDEYTMSLVQGACSYLSVYDALNHSRGWDINDWFLDRVRLYQSIIENEPQDGEPPSIYIACHLLIVICDSSHSLDEFPDIETSAEILDLCLSKNIFGGAIEQMNLYMHAAEVLTTTLPEITEVITEMHMRRLAG